MSAPERESLISARCVNPYCKDGWVERSDNASGGAPPFPCQVCRVQLPSTPKPRSLFSAAAERRIKRAVQTACEAHACDPGLAEIKLRRFHRAMDDLQSREEGEAVYDRLRGEGWYQSAAQALARVK